tara:strand:+ start:420 stop:623 length:204 start_codon:yes stop_codon:yes gene_type:complete
MSKLNSINGGYDGGSPRVRSENSRKVTPLPPQPIDIPDMVNKIREWHADGKISQADLQQLISELNKI